MMALASTRSAGFCARHATRLVIPLATPAAWLGALQQELRLCYAANLLQPAGRQGSRHGRTQLAGQLPVGGVGCQERSLRWYACPPAQEGKTGEP